MKPILISAALLALTGCMQTNATVSERNSAGIRLVTAPGVLPPIALASTQRTASQYCAQGHKQAIYLETRPLQRGAMEHAYICR